MYACIWTLTTMLLKHLTKIQYLQAAGFSVDHFQLMTPDVTDFPMILLRNYNDKCMLYVYTSLLYINRL